MSRDNKTAGGFQITDGMLWQYTGQSVRLEVPAGVREIAESTFLGSDIESVSLPTGLSVIGRRCFDSCTRLKRVILPSSLTRIGEYAFADCRELKDISLPGKLTVIESCTFRGCRSIKEITIPSSVREIEIGAFADCRELEKIYIPKSVTNLQVMFNQHPFNGCSKLTIHTPSGSAAERLAEECGIPCKNTDASPDADEGHSQLVTKNNGTYAEAMSLYKAGTIDSIKAAIQKMSEIAPYGDSEDRINEFRSTLKKEQRYNTALLYMESFSAKSIGHAVDLFSELGSYKDSPQRLSECRKKLTQLDAMYSDRPALDPTPAVILSVPDPLPDAPDVIPTPLRANTKKPAALAGHEQVKAEEPTITEEAQKPAPVAAPEPEVTEKPAPVAVAEPEHIEDAAPVAIEDPAAATTEEPEPIKSEEPRRPAPFAAPEPVQKVEMRKPAPVEAPTPVKIEEPAPAPIKEEPQKQAPADPAPRHAAPKRSKSRTFAKVAGLVLLIAAVAVGSAAIATIGRDGISTQDSTETVSDISLEDFVSHNPDAAKQITDSVGGTNVSIDVSGNTLRYIYDLSESEDMTEEIASSDEMKASLEQSLDGAEESFTELCSSLEADTGIKGIAVEVDYNFGAETLLSRTYTAAGRQN